MTEPENYTVEEMAELLRTTPAALHSMRSRGQAPPAFRIGKRILFPRRSYEHWREARLEQAPRANLRAVR